MKWLLALLLALPSGAWADRNAIIDALQAERAAYLSGDYEVAIRMMPRRQLEVMGAALDVDVDGVVEQLVARTGAGTEILELVGLSQIADKVNVGTTVDGATYGVSISTVYLRSDEMNLMALSTPRIVFEEDNRWVITRLQTPRDRVILRQAYPEFADVQAPAPRMERVWSNEVPAEALE